jgi:hypothetical protein
MNWRNYIIRLIHPFEGRVVGSLDPEALESLIPWAEEVEATRPNTILRW